MAHCQEADDRLVWVDDACLIERPQSLPLPRVGFPQRAY
jgi:hypothetical protein